MSSNDWTDADVVTCDVGVPLCQGAIATAPARVEAVRATFVRAHNGLVRLGIDVKPPVVVLDAPVGQAVALSVRDAGDIGLHDFAGRPAILFNANAPGETDVDTWAHELTHVYLRANGWSPPRWARVEDHLSHAGALIHEGIADFIAAASTRDATIGERLGFAEARRDLTTRSICPTDLTGFPHQDAHVVSSALWALGGASEADLAVVARAAISRASAEATDVGAWMAALATELVQQSPRLAARWVRVATERGLLHCDAPIDLDAAFMGSRPFLAAGTSHFNTTHTTGPLSFAIDLRGHPSVRLAIRSDSRALGVRWQLEARSGRRIADETAALEQTDAPSIQAVTIPTPKPATRLVFAIESRAPKDTTYVIEAVELVAGSGTLADLSTAAAPSGCMLGSSTSALPIAVACALLVRASQRRWSSTRERRNGAE